MFNITIINEIQINTTIPFTSTRTVIIQKTDSNQCWRGHEKTGIPIHCWWQCKMVQPHGKNSLAVPQNVKPGPMAQDFTPSYISKRTENMCSYKHLQMNVHSSIIHGSQKVKTPPYHQLMKGCLFTHTMEYNLTIKK